jgi:hypothetical protein
MAKKGCWCLVVRCSLFGVPSARCFLGGCPVSVVRCSLFVVRSAWHAMLVGGRSLRNTGPSRSRTRTTNTGQRTSGAIMGSGTNNEHRTTNIRGHQGVRHEQRAPDNEHQGPSRGQARTTSTGQRTSGAIKGSDTNNEHRTTNIRGHQGVRHEQRTPDNEHQGPSRGQARTTNNGQRTTNNDQRPTNNQQRTTTTAFYFRPLNRPLPR